MMDSISHSKKTSLSRRDFLKMLTATSAAGLLAGCIPAQGITPATQPVATGPIATGTRVAAIRGTDLYAMSHEALDALGGIQTVVKAGERVFIKPNFVTLPWASRARNPFTLGECTKPEIVIAVAEECLKAGAGEVTIGDGSQMPSFDWKLAGTLDGSTDLAAEAGRLNRRYGGKLRLACLDADTPEWIEVPTRASLSKVAVSNLVTQADRVISIPVAKTHRLAILTLAMKNFIGITPLARYGWKNAPNYDRPDLHRHDYTPEAVAQLVRDLTKAARPDLTIVDFSIGLEADGPSTPGGSPVNVKDRLGSWLLLASTDIVAAEATAARVMQHEEAYVQRILTMAHEEGLGEIDPEKIELVGATLNELQIEWKPARLQFG